jgi:hypothetical protein
MATDATELSFELENTQLIDALRGFAFGVRDLHVAAMIGEVTPEEYPERVNVLWDRYEFESGEAEVFTVLAGEVALLVAAGVEKIVSELIAERKESNV